MEVINIRGNLRVNTWVRWEQVRCKCHGVMRNLALDNKVKANNRVKVSSNARVNNVNSKDKGKGNSKDKAKGKVKANSKDNSQD